MPPQELVFLPLGGAGEIGLNLNLYGLDRQWLMVDLGLSFADDTLPGVDIILPDPSFIAARRHDLHGLVLTHAHEDHFGAIPYLWDGLRCPIFCTAFTAAVLRRKLEEHNLKGVPVHVVTPGERFMVGGFDCCLIQITHSIPEAHVLAIRTPLGNVLHTGDWKLDPGAAGRRGQRDRPAGGVRPGGRAGHGRGFDQRPEPWHLRFRGGGPRQPDAADRPADHPGGADHLRLQHRPPGYRDQGRPRARPRALRGRPLDAPHDRGRARGRLSPGRAGADRRAHRRRAAARRGVVAGDRLPGRAARSARQDRCRAASLGAARGAGRGRSSRPRSSPATSGPSTTCTTAWSPAASR